MEPVRSRRNPRVARALRLQRSRHRAETGLILLEGPHLLVSALRSGVAPQTVFFVDHDEVIARAESAGAETVRVSEKVMDALAETQHPRGPVTVADRPRPSPVTRDRLLVCWGLQDPGNLGTLIRTAAALGFGLITTGDGADPWGPKVLRAAAGSHFATTIEQRPSMTVDDLRAREYETIACVTRGGVPPDELSPSDRVAILIGSEARGLPEAARQRASQLVTIPMSEASDSLNAAVAGAIVAYEVVRRLPDKAESPPGSEEPWD